MVQDEVIFGYYNLMLVLINFSVVGFDNFYQLQLNVWVQWLGFLDVFIIYVVQYNGLLGDNFGLGVGVLIEFVV